MDGTPKLVRLLLTDILFQVPLRVLKIASNVDISSFDHVEIY